jgi:hypothetical protein
MTSPDHGAPPGRQGWRRRAHAVFAERLGLKATALVLSLLIWVVVGARQPTESYLSVHVTPELDSSLVLLGDPPVVRALIAGRAADLAKLYAAPPVVRRKVGGDAPDTLVLDVSPGDVHIPVDLKIDVRVLEVEPRSVTLRFETRASRRVSIVNEGRISVAGGTARVLFDPETVRISGPRRIVRSLRAVSPSALSIAAGDTMPHVAELDTAGLGVRVSPAQVKVRARGSSPAGAP